MPLGGLLFSDGRHGSRNKRDGEKLGEERKGKLQSGYNIQEEEKERRKKKHIHAHIIF